MTNLVNSGGILVSRLSDETKQNKTHRCYLPISPSQYVYHGQFEASNDFITTLQNSY